MICIAAFFQEQFPINGSMKCNNKLEIEVLKIFEKKIPCDIIKVFKYFYIKLCQYVNYYSVKIYLLF